MASLYWVGGSATWDGTAGTKWASTSGGAGGQPVPTSSDDVFFDAASGAVTITTSGTATDNCRSLDCTGFTGTLLHFASTQINIGTSTPGPSNVALKLATGMTYTRQASAFFQFVASTGTQQTVTTNGITAVNYFFANATGNWILADGLTSAAGITFNSGTFSTGNQAINIAAITSNSGSTRSLALGSSAITLTGTGTVWNIGNGTGLTVSANTSVITINGAGATFTSTGVNYNGTSLVFTGSGSAVIGGGASNTFKDVTRTGTAAKTDGFFLSQSQTYTGTLTINGQSVVNRMLVATNANVGITTTQTAAAISLSNCDFRDIIAAGLAGNAAWTGTSMGDCLGNTNITFDAPATQTRSSTGGTWSDSTRWTSRVPLPQDDVIVGSGSTGALTADMPRMGKSIDFTGNATTLSLTSTANTIFGSLTLDAAMTLSSTQTMTFSGRSTHTVTSAGKRFGSTVTFAAPSATYTLQDTFITTGALTHTTGTLNFNTANVTCTILSSNTGLSQSLLLGTGITTLTSTGTVLNVNNNANTFIANLATIVISDASASTKTVAWPVGSLASTRQIGNLVVLGGGTGAVILSPQGNGANGQLGNLVVTGPKTIQGVIAGTQTALSLLGGITFNSSVGNVITFTSTVGGTAFPISKVSGRVVIDYATLQDIPVSGGAAFYAGSHSTNTSGNTGWLFTSARPLGANTARTLAGTRTLAGVRTVAGARTQIN